MKNGWIALHRKIYTSTDFKSQLEVAIFLYLLCMASYQVSKVTYRKKQIILKRGDVCIAYRDLAKKFNLTVSKIRTIIKNLKSSGNLAQTLNKNLSIFSIVKYSKYQNLTDKKNTNLADRRTTITTITNSNTNFKKNMISLSNMTAKPKKIEIPILKNLQSKLIEKPKPKTEFQIMREKLDAEDYAKWVLRKLNS